ncbi:MAG: alkaline phosphatase family protein [Candidatus Helarchaeota archaeon]|nr:alkaline phosphatase family protein [Candidatus Helarchaeota archaeon]
MKKNERIVLFIIAILIGFGFTINFIATSLFPPQEEDGTLHRVILFSIDAGNPEYLSEEMMPKLFSEIMERGSKYKYALTSLAAETQHGHTSMLTGAYTNNSGMIGNGLYLNDTGETIAVVLDPSYRLAETLIEAIERTTPSNKTAFISGKWRLPPLLSNASDYIFASPGTEMITGDPYPLPDGYLEKLGTPVTYADGDIVDTWCMRALIELIKQDDPDFIFVNLAWTDVQGHYSGGIGDYSGMIKRHLRELDNLFMHLFTELKAMGEYENTLFVFTADHGMETVENVVDIEGYLIGKGIQNHVHVEGGSGFIFLENLAETSSAVDLLLQHPDVAVVLNRSEMNQYPYCLNTTENRTGQIYISLREHMVLSLRFPGLPELPLSQIGSHGGVALQDVIMAWMGPNITRTGTEITTIVPHVVDIVPTICNITGWALPADSQGRVLSEIVE